VLPYSKGAFRYENIHVLLRNLRLHDVTILLTAVIPSVENFYSIDFYYEHGSSDNMPCHIRRELDAIFLRLYSKFHRLYAFHAVLDMLIVKESLFSLHLCSVSYQVLVYIFGGASHIDLSFVVVLVKEIGKGTAVVKVSVGNDHKLNL